MQILAGFAVVTPAKSAGSCIDGHDVRVAGGQIKSAVIENGSGFKCGTAPVLDPLAQLAGAECPGHTQLADVGGGDLGQRGVSSCTGVPTVRGPTGLRRTGGQSGGSGDSRNTDDPCSVHDRNLL